MTLRCQGDTIQDDARSQPCEERYGLNQPIFMQYGKWIGGDLHRGDCGHIHGAAKTGQGTDLGAHGADRCPFADVDLFVSWFIAIPLGVFSATHQYSILDYIVTSYQLCGDRYAGLLCWR